MIRLVDTQRVIYSFNGIWQTSIFKKMSNMVKNKSKIVYKKNSNAMNNVDMVRGEI